MPTVNISPHRVVQIANSNTSVFNLVNSAVNMTLPNSLLSAVLRRRCCRAPASAAVDRHFLPARRSTANPPHSAVAVERWDRQTDGRLTVT